MQKASLCAWPTDARNRYITKTLMIMQLTGIFLLVCGLTLSARTVSQTVTYSGTDVPLRQVLQSVRQQTGTVFFFDAEVVAKAHPVTIEAHQQELKSFLDAILKNQPLRYTIEANAVVIYATPMPSKTPSTPAAVPITGVVRDADGKPISGANVVIKGTRKGVATNPDGSFKIDANEGDIMVVSSIGFGTKEIKVGFNKLIEVNLTVSNSPLDQVQVIAYGTTSLRLSTGNISTVSSKEIGQQPVTNPLLALQGRVTGLFITQANGIPGSAVTVRIQGQNSISNGNNPFYVIDGVPYSSQGLQNLTYASGSGDPLNLINPSNIESITILKDADATAIYGSRAANGAILITTKSGKTGDIKVDINLQTGWSQIGRKVPLLNTKQYLQMRHEAIANDGLTVQPTDYDLNGTWDSTRYTDWQKVLIGGTSQYSNLNASVSGGTANTQYLVGGTFNRQTTVFPGNFADKKGDLHFNLITASSDKKFKLQLSASYLLEDNRLPGQDLTGYALKTSPNAPELYNADGSLNWALDQNGISSWGVSGNPMAYTEQKYLNKNANLISNAVISYEIIPGLEFKSNFGYTNQQVNETTTSPLTYIAPADRPYRNRSAAYSNNNSHSWIIEPQLNYLHAWDKLKFDALAGTTIQQNSINSLQFYGIGYNSDLVLEDPISAGQTFISGSTISTYKYNALFARLNFNWDDKYVLNFSARRDGSSHFGPSNQFHDFGAVGLGWIFSNGEYIKNTFSVLSFGKLKASYGTTGSDQIGDYKFLSLYGPTGSLPYQGIVTIAPQGLTNPYLQWEETKKLEAGVDLGFLKDRILFTGVYVRNRSSNQLLSYDLPVISGFYSIARNFPATVQNTEWEFSLKTINIKTTNFTWTTQINLTIPKNTLASFPNLEQSTYSYLKLGKSVSGTTVFHFLGVNDTTGVYQYSDSKGNATYNPSYGIDNTVFVDYNPKVYGGFGNNFQFKNLELDLLFQFVKQQGQNYTFGNNPGNLAWGNQPTYVLDRWQKPGDHARIQRFNSDYTYFSQWSNAGGSDAGIIDASYIRLKNLSLSWRMPETWQNTMHLKNCKLYVSAQNLLTITHYKGLDPEVPGAGSTGLPPLRVLTVGLQAAF